MSPHRDLPAWRSMLFVPAHVQRFLDKAHQRGADALILDLEDSVPPAAKAEARADLAAKAALAGRGGADVCVRINQPICLAAEDLRAAVCPGVSAILLPKAMGAGHVRLVSDAMTELEIAAGLVPGAIGLVPVIEDIRSLAEAQAIADASPRNVGLAVGSEDFAADLDAQPVFDALYPAKMAGLYAARAAGILPIGLLSGFSDIGGDRDDALRRSRAAGFAAAMCIHPDHVAPINSAFGVDAGTLTQAEALLAAFDAARAEGRGAIEFGGRMVDLPVAERARKLVRRAQRQRGTAE